MQAVGMFVVSLPTLLRLFSWPCLALFRLGILRFPLLLYCGARRSRWLSRHWVPNESNQTASSLSCHEADSDGCVYRLAWRS